MFALFVILALAIASFADKETPLEDRYRFSQQLDRSGQYWLYWSFDSESIAFGVSVETTGWVGFGLSPNGQMPQSDVVIGWVDTAGEPHFDDRFAVGRYEPEKDESQDWVLTNHKEADGRTILEFERKLLTCDEKDIPITADTARIIWSWGDTDPSGPNGLSKHTMQGTTSINLLGGLNEELPGLKIPDTHFDIRNENFNLPNDMDTTYWCRAVQLPRSVREKEHYVRKVSPVITPNDYQYVHHMVVFLCQAGQLNNTDFSGDCGNGVPPPRDVQACITSTAFASWAIGGDDFLFPKDVAFPVGGVGNEEYVVLEIHYDNPAIAQGVKDSSGMRFYYTATPPQHRAGIMTVGHDITRIMIIPPTSSGYTTSGICTPSCTKAILPEEGITVFANIFHTHLIGRQVKLRHYRQEDKSGLWKELKPLDENLKYDFNFQQYNILQSNQKVFPGDYLELECVYISDRENITLGGDRTSEEMCLSFFAYYPQVDLNICVSQPTLESFIPFIERFIDTEAHPLSTVLSHLENRDTEEIIEDFATVQWSSEAVEKLEHAVRINNISHICITKGYDSRSKYRVPEVTPNVTVTYQPPELCAISGASLTHYQSMTAIFVLMALFHLATSQH